MWLAALGYSSSFSIISRALYDLFSSMTGQDKERWLDFFKASKVGIAPNKDAICSATVSGVQPKWSKYVSGLPIAGEPG